MLKVRMRLTEQKSLWVTGCMETTLEVRKLPNSQLLVTGRVSCQSNTCVPFLPQPSLGICSWTLNLLPKELINTFCHLYTHHAIEYPVFGKPWWSSCLKQREGPNFCKAPSRSHRIAQKKDLQLKSTCMLSTHDFSEDQTVRAIIRSCTTGYFARQNMTRKRNLVFQK